MKKQIVTDQERGSFNVEANVEVYCKDEQLTSLAAALAAKRRLPLESTSHSQSR